MGAEHVRKAASTAAGITTAAALKLSGADLEQAKLKNQSGAAMTTKTEDGPTLALLAGANPSS